MYLIFAVSFAGQVIGYSHGHIDHLNSWIFFLGRSHQNAETATEQWTAVLKDALKRFPASPPDVGRCEKGGETHAALATRAKSFSMSSLEKPSNSSSGRNLPSASVNSIASCERKAYPPTREEPFAPLRIFSPRSDPIPHPLGAKERGRLTAQKRRKAKEEKASGFIALEAVGRRKEERRTTRNPPGEFRLDSEGFTRFEMHFIRNVHKTKGRVSRMPNPEGKRFPPFSLPRDSARASLRLSGLPIAPSRSSEEIREPGFPEGPTASLLSCSKTVVSKNGDSVKLLGPEELRETRPFDENLLKIPSRFPSVHPQSGVTNDPFSGWQGVRKRPDVTSWPSSPNKEAGDERPIVELMLGMVWLGWAYPADQEDEGDFLVRPRRSFFRFREAMSPDADADADPDAFPDPLPSKGWLFGYQKNKKYWNAKNFGAFG
ncbi:unnamed protein product [Darwinula stevensoni]|uniref:Uncharacterized protein n=1 Tax=Darwinula stevensoni TaxID=69355 RepID=A0A7R8XGW2_9CRUS|nr:unnamed protein product [Darwinula stevensoni]CAG0891876.1 unnamed protein product [Darwinula stevensoni]